MSHYTVMVVTKDDSEETLEAAMAPFDEQVEVEEYQEFEDGEPGDYWRVKGLRVDGYLPAEGTLTWAEVSAALKAGRDEELLVDDEGRAYSMTTYNPQSKWDWWQVGGRWPGKLLHVDGFKQDKLQRGKYDLDGTRSAAEAKFRADAEGPRKIFALHGYRTWDDIRESVPDIDSARRTYWDQAAIVEYNLTLPQSERWRADGDFLDKVMLPEDEFERQVKIEVARSVTCYATLDLDGRWNEPGKMGWFGMSSETESTSIGYYEAMNAMIQSLDDDVWLTVVDCHI